MVQGGTTARNVPTMRRKGNFSPHNLLFFLGTTMTTHPHPFSLEELHTRHAACKKLLGSLVPQAQGFLAFSRVSIYYLSGTMANATFWLPLEGDPVLFVRKSVERAHMESPLPGIVPYRSFGDIYAYLQGTGLPTHIACEKSMLPWSMAENLIKRMPGIHLLAGDAVMHQARASKTALELGLMRHAGAMHHKGICHILPQRMRPGMTERAIAVLISDIFLNLGHDGTSRMAAFGEEAVLGHISAGENGNYPSHFNGPLGLCGIHPAAPFMGSEATVWQPNTLLSIDTGFSCQGYQTDKTQIFFSGPEKKLPSQVKEAHALCLAIEQEAAAMLRPGAIPAEIYAKALRMAEEGGFAQGFMGLGGNHVPFLGHGIGLAVDEWPVLATGFEVPLPHGLTMAIEPKIGIPGVGMVGSENTYELTENGGVPLSGGPQAIICLEE